MAHAAQKNAMCDKQKNAPMKNRQRKSKARCHVRDKAKLDSGSTNHATKVLPQKRICNVGNNA
jgi:hypothetical protein